jgi:hypothetical protein
MYPGLDHKVSARLRAWRRWFIDGLWLVLAYPVLAYPASFSRRCVGIILIHPRDYQRCISRDHQQQRHTYMFSQTFMFLLSALLKIYINMVMVNCAGLSSN